jgi:hypothetical protein
MAFTDQFPYRQLTVLAQDPSVLDRGKVLTDTVAVPNERLTPGPKGHRVHVVDYDSSTDRHIAPLEGALDDDPFLDVNDVGKLVDNPHFHAQNVYALTSATLLRFEEALGRRMYWGVDSGAHQIKIAPHAFREANAFYSRRDESLMFGYFPSGRKMVFTCLSHDVVVHEATHAILDGLRREFTRPSSPDQAAFHEAFADLVALLSTFRMGRVVRFALLRGRRRDQRIITEDRITIDALRRSVLIGLAEEFGSELTGVRGDPLRRSAALPEGVDYLNQPEFREAHRRGEVLVAAVMNTFLKIWTKRLEALDPVGTGKYDLNRVVEEGVVAAAHLLRMIIRAIDYTPPIDITFSDFLSAMLTADREAAPDDRKYGYRKILQQTFGAYFIRPVSSKGSESGLWLPPADDIIYGHSGHAEMQWDREAVFRFIWENREALSLYEDAYTYVASVRPVVRAGPDSFVLRETVVECVQLINLEARELMALDIEIPEGMPNSMPILLLGGAALIFDDYGRLKYTIGTSVAGKHQSDRLNSLWSNGEFSHELRAERRFARMHRERAMRSSSYWQEQW